MIDLSHLNPPQREAVKTTEGPLLVLAGAGSGKTRVITHRIVHLLEKKVSPKAILAVTFTNKSASEMKERVIKMAGQKAAGVTLSTFHAFGAEVLREHLGKLGWPKKFAIADTGDQVSIVRRAMRERNVDDKAFDGRKVLTLISRAKNSGIDPQADQPASAEGTPRSPRAESARPRPSTPLEMNGDPSDSDDPEAEEGPGDDYELVAQLVYPLYQLALKAQGAVDFDDLLVFPSIIFARYPEVKAKYVARFRYLMVDEYQDTNRAQLQLLRHLAGTKHNVCVVGDDDQCIYSWRGAEVKNILQFETYFPGAKTVRLEQNYRSTPIILDAANAVIERNPERRAKRMWTDERGGPLIQVVVAPSEDEEARYVAHEVKKAIGEGLPPDEIAILYRTNGQARPLEESLREKQVYYEVVGGQEFFDRREIKDVIAYFKVIANRRDEVSLLRIVNVPPRGIGDVTLERLTAHSVETEAPLWETLAGAALVPGLPKGAPEKVVEFCALIERYRKLFDRGNLADVTRKLLAEIDFDRATRGNTPSLAAGDRKVKAVGQLLQSLEAYEQREAPKASLLTYLNRLTLDSREEEDEHEHAHSGRVTLMTLHGAKGLEWRLVFLVGLEEDLLPHSGMQGEPPNPEEERRLCYVGMTRARERLVLTRAATRIKRGREQPRTPSRFLDDLPEGLLELIDLAGVPAGPPDELEQSFFARLKEKLKAKAT